MSNNIKAFADVQAAPTTMTITFTSPSGTQPPGQHYTLTGYLRDSNNAGLRPNKPIELRWHYAGETDWKYWQTLQTGADGKSTTTDGIDYQSVYLKATFPGDATDAASSQEIVVTIA